MTARNNMDTADPQAVDTFEATSGNSKSSTQRSRRTVRIAVSLPVVVRDQFGGREETRTQFVMVRGAVVATTSNVRVGHKLTLQIAKTGRAAECTVTSVDPVLKDGHSAEVEFTRDQPDFWPVQFPTEDFKTDSGSYRFSAPAAQSTIASPSSSFVDTPRREARDSSAVSHGSNEIVSLADSIVGNSLSGNSFGQPEVNKAEKFIPRSAPVDSVAQFRAANRAAHRREQRTRFMYSILSLAALAAALMGARYWMQHRSEIAEVKLPQVSLPSISQVLPKSKPSAKPTTPTPAVSEEPSAESSATAPAPRMVETPHSTHVPVPSETPAPPVAPEVNQPAETQVAVRHEAGSTSVHKAVTVQDAGEEPLALPLKVDDNSSPATKPEVLNEVVAQTPMKAALLAPQPARKAVPARLIQSAPAQYPPMARQIRVEGEVVISLDVDTSGKVSAARAVSGPPILRTAALDAVRRWKYQPATLGDKPVVSTEVVKVQFKLR